MIIEKMALPRRSFLRGVGVTVSKVVPHNNALHLTSVAFVRCATLAGERECCAGHRG